MSKPTIAELQAQLAEMTARATAAEQRAEQLAGSVETLTGERDAARRAAADGAKTIDVLEQEKRELSNQLRAYKGSATKAREQVTILKAEMSPQARPIGRMKPVRGEDAEAERKAALEAAFAQGPTQIVFSDGRREIRELAPLVVTGTAAWLQTPRRRELNDDQIIEPVGERNQVELAGFGLLNEAGEQVGWCELPTPIVIGRGQKTRIPKGSIHF